VELALLAQRLQLVRGPREAFMLAVAVAAAATSPVAWFLEMVVTVAWVALLRSTALQLLLAAVAVAV
jgi:hypothetical protein